MSQNNEQTEVRFENESFGRPIQSLKIQTPRMVQWIIKFSNGYIKNEKQATYILIGFIVIAVIITSLFVLTNKRDKAELKAPFGYKIIYPENAPPRLEKLF